MNHRNLIILSLSQSLGFAGAPLIIFAGGVTGTMLAPFPAWATMPIAAMVVGVALFTVPAALVMKKIGRRLGFMAGSLFAAIASLAAAHAIGIKSFSLFFCARRGNKMRQQLAVGVRCAKLSPIQAIWSRCWVAWSLMV